MPKGVATGIGMTEEGRLALSESMKRTQEKRLADYYPVEPLREAYLKLREREGLTLTEVARRMDWFCKSGTKAGQPDGGRVSRTLGMRTEMGRSGRYECTRQRTNPDLALALCEAIGAYWWELWPDA
jgi:hypothetical protein